MVLEDILKHTHGRHPEKVREAMNNLKAGTAGLRGGHWSGLKENHFRTVNYYRVYKWDSASKSIKKVKDWTHSRLNDRRFLAEYVRGSCSLEGDFP